ncbi:MAG: hypothetical protein U9N57_00960 [Pseudomonadota bacterium]|nr:hypothetical protein [Pseudomonadota bacterium]
MLEELENGFTINGKTVLECKKEWGMTTLQMQNLLGLSTALWNSITKDDTTPIKNASTKILIRYYQANRDDLPQTNFEKLRDDFVAQLARVRPDTWEEDMLLILGDKSITSSYRWFDYGNKMNPSTAQLAILITRKLKECRTKKEADEFLKKIEYIKETIKAESD